MNSFHSIPMPKPVKLSPPKISSVHMQKVGNGFKVAHHMTHGPSPQHYVFQDPRKALQHINRISANQWRTPGQNPATGIEKSLNI
jgi:hypothetical protein